MSQHSNKSTGMQIYRRLLTYVKPFKFVFLLAILGNIGFASVDASIVALLKPLLDQGLIKQDPEFLKSLPLLLLLLALCRGVLSFVASYCMAYVGRRVVLSMRQSLFAHMMDLPTSYFDNNTTGQLLSRITYNTSQVASASTDALKTLVKEGATVIFLFGVMVYHSWQLTLSFAIIGPCIYVIIRYVSKRFRRLSKKTQESMGNITHVAEEALIGNKVVKIFGAQQLEINDFNAITQKNFREEMKMALTKAATSPVVLFLVITVLAFTIHIGSESAFSETVSPGTIVSVLVAMMMLMRPVKKLTDINNTIQKGIAGAESIFEVLDHEKENDQGQLEHHAVNKSLQFENLSFAYDPQKGNVLDDISLTVPSKKTIALVGRSGSGKSTLVNLLPRFYDQYEGKIFIDDISIQDITLKSLRSMIALVSQHVVLFNDTIAKNIAYNCENVTREDIEKAAKAAHVLEFAEKLPNGLDTLIGENGVTLSGGQRQRIAIARALIVNAPILILDEATSALDTESERLIQSALNELMRDRTTLVIAHRLSTIENANSIVVLDKGRIVEQGTHKELMQLNKHYAKLHQLQFGHG